MGTPSKVTHIAMFQGTLTVESSPETLWFIECHDGKPFCAVCQQPLLIKLDGPRFSVSFCRECKHLLHQACSDKCHVCMTWG